MGLESAIKRFRRRERATWRCEGKLTRATGVSAFNEATGKEEPEPPDTIYEGPCQVRATARSGRRDAQAGEREIRISASTAKFPSETQVAIGDWLEVTASIHDPGLAGRSFRVSDVIWDGWQVARVAILEETNPNS